jgi:hypothetical protein
MRVQVVAHIKNSNPKDSQKPEDVEHQQLRLERGTARTIHAAYYIYIYILNASTRSLHRL